MKKFVLIIISVIMLFSACVNQTENITDTTTESCIETSAPKTQIDPAEEFGGVLFGMTKDEVIAALGREPDYTYSSGNSISYKRQVFFNVAVDGVDYDFDENGNLDYIFITCSYRSAKEQMPIDIERIKEELSKRYPEYPEKTKTYIYENSEDLSLFTENRLISLNIYDDLFTLSISPRDESK